MISYLAALLAAVTNATSNALNRKAARETPGRDQFRLRLISDLLHRRVWLAAISLMFLSFVFSAVALGTGQLAAVQLLIILELPLTLIIGARILQVRITAQEWAGTAAMTGGVIGLLVLLNPQPGPSRAVGLTRAVALIRSPRLQALQADGTGPGDAPDGPPERREWPVKAAGHQ